MQLYEAARADVVSVFVLPPSIAELKARLERRAQDEPEVIARRLANAELEIQKWSEYDYVIVNRDVQESHAALTAILRAERVRRERVSGLGDFVAELTADLQRITG